MNRLLLSGPLEPWDALFCSCSRSAIFRAQRIKFLASGRSAGSKIKFRGQEHTVEELEPDAFNGIDLAIGSTPDEVAKDFVPWAVERGCVVVDESGYWRMDPKVPLVIPEVNPDAVLESQGHHRQPELFDHAIGRGDEAAARCGAREARRRQHLSGHQRRRAWPAAAILENGTKAKLGGHAA